MTPATLTTAITLTAGSDTLAYVPDVARRLCRLGASVSAVRVALLDACKAGAVELRPEGGIGTLSAADRLVCPTGFDGQPLSWVRVR